MTDSSTPTAEEINARAKDIAAQVDVNETFDVSNMDGFREEISRLTNPADSDHGEVEVTDSGAEPETDVEDAEPETGSVERIVRGVRDYKDGSSGEVRNVFFTPGARYYATITPTDTFTTVQSALDAGFIPQGGWEAQGLNRDDFRMSYVDDHAESIELSADQDVSESFATSGVDQFVYGDESNDDGLYTEMIEIGPEEPQALSEVKSEQVSDLALRLVPTVDDLADMLDTTIDVEPIGPTSLNAKQFAENQLAMFKVMLTKPLKSLKSYQFSVDKVRSIIEQGRVPSISQMLINRYAARQLKINAVELLAQTEREYEENKKRWIAETMAELERQYNEEHPPFTDDIRREWFADAEARSQEMLRQADEMFERARAEVRDIMLAEDGDDDAISALSNFGTMKYQARHNTENAVEIDRQNGGYHVPRHARVADTADNDSSSATDDDTIYQTSSATDDGEFLDGLEDLGEDYTNVSGVSYGDPEDDDDFEYPDDDESVDSDFEDSSDDYIEDDEDEDMFASLGDKPSETSKKNKKAAKKVVNDSGEEHHPGDQPRKTKSFLSKLLAVSDQDENDKAKSDSSSEKSSGQGSSRAEKPVNQWVKDHKKTAIIGGAGALVVLGGLGIGGAAVISAGGDSQEKSNRASTVSTNPEAEAVQKKFAVGDKMSVVSDGKIISVTIKSFGADGALAKDSSDKSYSVTNDQLKQWADEHPESLTGENKVSPSPSDTKLP